jgi:hypothetical protein
LKTEVIKLGQPRWIIAPNRLHYWWVPDWKAAFPATEIYLAPRVIEQAGTRIDFPYSNLEHRGGYAWDKDIATLPVTGSYMTEVVFFHRPSRTLLLADLIENFEPEKLSCGMRYLAWLGGCLAPNGSTPRDLRFTYGRQNPELREAVEKMISWDPERVILAHGCWYQRDGANELKRALRWALPPE